MLARLFFFFFFFFFGPPGGFWEFGLIFGETERRGVTAGFLDEPLSYARRTELVVRYSDGVVIFSQTEPGTNKVNTPGSALTIRLAEQFDKPVLINPKSKEEILSFLMRHNIKRLNIAGAGASEPSYFANNPDYRSIIEGALEDVKDLTSGDAKSELRKNELYHSEHESENLKLFTFDLSFFKVCI